MILQSYSWREAIASILFPESGHAPWSEAEQPGRWGAWGLGGLLGQLGLGGASAGGILSGGLGELLERFQQSGQADTAKSWVNTGPNKPCTAEQLEQAIGPEVLETLSRQTGLPRDELVSRLCRELPDAVDKYTPEGRLPTEAELSRA